MTSTEFTTHVRYKTRTNSTTFTDAEIMALMKIRQDEIARAILRVDEDILLIPQTCDLVADQREYPFPSDIIAKIKRVEVKLDGTNWIPITEIDVTDIGYSIASESNITSIFNNQQANKENPSGARFDIRRKAIYILSGTITAVTTGLRLLVSTYPSAIAALDGTTDMATDPSDTTHGIPRALHELWARGVTIDYKESRQQPIALSETEKNYKNDLNLAIETLKHGNLNREVYGSIPSGGSRGNEGSDY